MSDLEFDELEFVIRSGVSNNRSEMHARTHTECTANIRVYHTAIQHALAHRRHGQQHPMGGAVHKAACIYAREHIFAARHCSSMAFHVETC